MAKQRHGYKNGKINNIELNLSWKPLASIGCPHQRESGTSSSRTVLKELSKTNQDYLKKSVETILLM